MSIEYLKEAHKSIAEATHAVRTRALEAMTDAKEFSVVDFKIGEMVPPCGGAPCSSCPVPKPCQPLPCPPRPLPCKGPPAPCR